MATVGLLTTTNITSSSISFEVGDLGDINPVVYVDITCYLNSAQIGNTRRIKPGVTVTFSELQAGTKYAFEHYVQFVNGSNQFFGTIEVTTSKQSQGSNTWTFKSSSFNNISDLSSSIRINIDEKYRVNVIPIKFSRSGNATFYTDSTTNDTYGFLCSNQAIGGMTTNIATGRPLDNIILAEDDDSHDGKNFRITYSVEADVTYYVWIRMVDGSKTGRQKLWVVFSPYVDVAVWSWSANAENAINCEPGYTVGHFSYEEWNDFCDKVVEVLDAKSLTWLVAPLSLNDTKMTNTEEGRKLTANRFNSLRSNVDRLFATGISSVAPKEPVLGSYFITLAGCVNTAINLL